MALLKLISRKLTSRNTILYCLLLLITFYIAWGSVSYAESTGGGTAESFSSLKNLDGTQAQLLLPHSKTLVYFWATWCPECREHIKDSLPALEKKNKFNIVTVVMDKDQERASQFITKEKVLLKTYRDPDKKLTNTLKVFSVPVWAVYEKKGKDWILLKSESGSDDEKMLQALGEAK